MINVFRLDTFIGDIKVYKLVSYFITVPVTNRAQ